MDRTGLSDPEAAADASLRHRPSALDSRPGSAASTTDAASDVDDESGYQPLWVRLACILLDFLTQTYDQIRIVPEIVLFERWLCGARFPELAGQLAGHELCRTPEVQYELARLRSWKAFFDGVASMPLIVTAFIKTGRGC